MCIYNESLCWILMSAFNGSDFQGPLGWLIGICSYLCSSLLTLCTILDQTRWSRPPCTFCRSRSRASRSRRIRQQQSLPLTREFGVLSLCVHCSSSFICSDQGLDDLIHTALCAAQALATVELWLSFLVKSDGSGFGEHSGMVLKKFFPFLSNQKPISPCGI